VARKFSKKHYWFGAFKIVVKNVDKAGDAIDEMAWTTVRLSLQPFKVLVSEPWIKEVHSDGGS
jgi:hypothetical protein